MFNVDSLALIVGIRFLFFEARRESDAAIHHRDSDNFILAKLAKIS